MRENFDKWLQTELRYEGGFSNHPRDPGGVTLEGIIQRVYDGFRDRAGKPRRPLTPQMRGTGEWQAERNAIFRKQYWDAVRGDELPAGVDLFVADSAVNSGPHQAVLWLQRALGNVKVNGELGEATLAALMLCSDHDALIADMASRRLGMLRHLSTWDAFGKGWSARVSNVKAIGQKWAVGSVGPAPVDAHLQGGDAKAYASDVAQPFMDSGNATKITVGSTGFAGLVSQAQEQLSPLVGTSDFVDKIILGLTVAGVVIAIGSAAYSLWADRKTKRAQRAIDGDVLAEVPEGQPA